MQIFDILWGCLASEARVEAAAALEGEESAAQREVRARSVYERAFTEMRAEQAAAKEEALMLLEAWREFESTCTAKCGASPLLPVCLSVCLRGCSDQGVMHRHK